MNHAAGFQTVQPVVAVDRHGLIELQDEFDIGALTLRGFSIAAEFRAGPHLPLVLAEVLDDERPYVRNRKQPLARRVDSKAAEIASNPAAAQLLRDRRSCPAAYKAV